MANLLQPADGIEMEGYRFLGRGSSATGPGKRWNRSELLHFRCAACGDVMPSRQTDYFTCQCGAMHHDADAFRFGSRFGDDNILVYEKQA